jgi:hypothetical protein
MRRPTKTALLGLPMYVLAVLFLGYLLLQTVDSDGDRGRILERIEQLEKINAREVADHREANQRDHNCIVKLALLLADPKRDRQTTITPPRECPPP